MGVRRLLEMVTGEVHDIVFLSTYISDKNVQLTVGNTEFSLRLKGGLRDAHHELVVVQSRGEIYEEVMVSCLSRILDIDKNACFIDVGSFMGYYACYVSAYLSDQSTVYAIESNKDYCEYIDYSIKTNRFQNTIVLNEALSDQRAVVSVWDKSVFIEEPEDKYAGLELSENRKQYMEIRAQAIDTEPYKVDSITLDELCERDGIKPTVLKIDVHGAEGKVLGGATRCLQESVHWVLLELHQEGILGQYSPGYTRRRVLDLLEQCQFDCYLVGGFRGTAITPERQHFREKRKPICIPYTGKENTKVGFDRNKEDIMILAVSKDVENSDKLQVYDTLQ